MSSSKPKHPYHLVDPSAWPILTAFAAGLMMTGAVLFMHKVTSWVLPIGTIAVVTCMGYWWKDVIKESVKQKAHNSVTELGLRYGMLLFILSEVAFFAAFFWAFFDSSLFPKAAINFTWPPAGIKTFNPLEIPYLNTLILLLSGTTVTWAHYAILQNNTKEFLKALGITVLLGISFTVLQAYEYHHAAFGFKDGIYASTFYMATGFHGFHVLVGTIFLAVCWFRGRKGHFDAKHHFGFEAAAWYWHFVDVIWLFLYVSIYWWGS